MRAAPGCLTDRPGATEGSRGAMTGVRPGCHDHAVLAADEMRHDAGTLTAVDSLLDEADAKRPQTGRPGRPAPGAVSRR